MALARDDRWVQDAQGRNLAGAAVYWCSQPATVPAVPPPAPLMTIYADLAGTQPITQPVLTDGFGHANVYLPEGTLYTLVVYHPLFGANPVALPDQKLGGGGGGGSTVTPFEGFLAGTIDGVNTTFTLTNGGVPLTSAPTQVTVFLNTAEVPFGVANLKGYQLSGVTVIFATPPQPATGFSPADVVFARGLYIL